MELRRGIWEINSNGFTGNLVITSVDAAGNVSGEVTGITSDANPIEGFWDSDANELTFLRTVRRNNQVYTGYMWEDRNQVSNASTFTLAGYFEAFADTGGTASRHGSDGSLRFCNKAKSEFIGQRGSKAIRLHSL